jgi:signal peptidase I
MTEEIQVPPKTGFFKSFWGEVLQIVVIAVVVVIPFRMYVAQPFLVSGPSMDDTFANGEYLIVDELTYETRTPHRGEVVIFKYPLDTKKYFIKRVIGLPTETVEIKAGQITIYNEAHPKGLVLDEPYVKVGEDGTARSDARVTLGLNEYYVMGDNRTVSSDSRIWGPVKTDLITGRPFLRLLPLNRLSFFPGQVQVESLDKNSR